MIWLLRFFSLRYAKTHPFRILLSAVAVALGVALFVSSDTSNYSTERAFTESNEKLQGKTQLQVTRGGLLGVEDSILEQIESVSGVSAAPVLQLSTTLPDLEGESTLLILGLDLKREASFRMWDVAEGDSPKIDMLAFAMGNGIVITQSLADRHGFKLGSKFNMDSPLGIQKMNVGAILKDEGAAQVFGGNIAVMPIANAQRMFKREGKVDRIELIIAGSVDEAAKKLSAALGSEYKVEPPPKSNSFLDDAISRIKALMGISVIALIVAIFIIYNSVSISVVQRIKEIGTLRAVGATRFQIFSVILMEWALIGLIGSLFGIAFGYALAHMLINFTMREINQMIPIVVLEKVIMPPRTIIGGLILGIVTSFLAAYFPGRNAMRIMPIELLRQGLYRIRMTAGYHREFWFGATLTAAAILIWIIRPTDIPNIGLGSAVLSFTGAAFLLPQLTFWTARMARPFLGRVFRTEAFLAADNISKFPQRTALTVVALAGALGMMVSAAALVTSFKVRGERWMKVTFPFDTSINATDLKNSFFSTATFPEDLIAKINALDVVEYCYGVRAPFQEYNGHTVMIIAPELELYNRMQSDRGMENFIPTERLPKLLSGEGVALSENLAMIHGLRQGDQITLNTMRGPKSFEVLGLLEDYSWPKGVVFMDRSIYKEYWEDTSLTYLNIRYKKGSDPVAAKARIAQELKGTYNLFIYDVKDLLSIANNTMDQTLKFTNMQVALAIFIGFLGIVNTLLISVMHRTRELGLLRAIGMLRGQIVKMVVVESVFLAVLAGGIGVFLGLVGAKWPLAMHVYQIGGFLMPLAIPWKHVIGAIIASGVIGFVASYVPARRAAGINVLDAIGYE